MRDLWTVLAVAQVMQPSPNDALFRVKRADQHITTLKRLEKRITRFGPDELTAHKNAQPPVTNPDGTVECLGDVGKFPAPLANSLWSAIYSPCAALDYLVYSLAWLDSGH